MPLHRGQLRAGASQPSASRRSAPTRQFQVDLTDRLAPGRYTLSALIAVNGNVMNAEVHRMEIVVPAPR